MDEREVGSKEWFEEKCPIETSEEPWAPAGSVDAGTWNEGVLFLFYEEKNKQNAYLSYHLVTESADICYLYRRKEVDVPASKFLEKLCSFPETIWLTYANEIIPLLETKSLDEVYTIKVLSCFFKSSFI